MPHFAVKSKPYRGHGRNKEGQWPIIFLWGAYSQWHELLLLLLMALEKCVMAIPGLYLHEKLLRVG